MRLYYYDGRFEDRMMALKLFLMLANIPWTAKRGHRRDWFGTEVTMRDYLDIDWPETSWSM